MSILHLLPSRVTDQRLKCAYIYVADLSLREEPLGGKFT